MHKTDQVHKCTKVYKVHKSARTQNYISIHTQKTLVPSHMLARMTGLKQTINASRAYSPAAAGALGVNRRINSAGCLIIGDEVLNGKILDTNSNTFAKFCFNKLMIPLKKTIVCSDDNDSIVRSLKALRDEDGCDFIITSGGIGPTHDDVTYQAIGDAYGLKCELDSTTVEKMQKLRGDYLSTLSERRLNAFYRMATIPAGENVHKIFVDEDFWVPIVSVDQKVYILPGVPQLFVKLLNGLEPMLMQRVGSEQGAERSLVRYYVKTETKESQLAPFLEDLQQSCQEKFGNGAVKLGSYPHFNWKVNTISIIGEGVENGELRKLVEQVIENIGGTEIGPEEEEKMTTTEPQ